MMDEILNYKKCDSDDFYCLIGCDETSSMEQILAEYKVLSLLYHPDKNPDDLNAVVRFQKIQQAKEILTDPDKRAVYNKWRRSGFAMSFDQFLNLNKAAHTSVHWATKKQKDLMIEESCCSPEIKCERNIEPDESTVTCRSWEREPAGKLLQSFQLICYLISTTAEAMYKMHK